MTALRHLLSPFLLYPKASIIPLNSPLLLVMIKYKIEKGAFRALLTQHHYEHSNLHSSTHIAMSVLIQSPAPYQVQGFKFMSGRGWTNSQEHDRHFAP